MKLLSSSKAQDQTLFFTMTVFLVLGVILFAFLTYINKATSSTYPEKNLLANDLALIIDTMQLEDGNLELSYPLSNKFLYEFENSKVSAADNKLDPKKGNGYFLMNKNTKLKSQEIKGDSLKIGREGDKIIIQESVNLNALKCDSKKVPFVRSLTAKGGELADTLNKLAASEFEEGDELILNINLKENSKNYLKIFYPKEKEKIACEIANKVSENLPFDGISIIPSDKFTIELSKNYDLRLQTIISSAIIEGVKNAEK